MFLGCNGLPGVGKDVTAVLNGPRSCRFFGVPLRQNNRNYDSVN